MKTLRVVVLALVASWALVALTVLLMVSPYVVRVGITNEAQEPIEAIPVGRFPFALVGVPPLFRAKFIIPIPRGTSPTASRLARRYRFFTTSMT